MTDLQQPGHDPVDPVEDALRAVLEERAQEPVWRASLATDAVSAARTPAVRRVPRAVAWLSAAAAVVVFAVGASALARGGTVTTPAASGPATTVRTLGDDGTGAPGMPRSGAPDVEYTSCAQARAALNGATADPHNRAMTIDPLYTGPGSGDWVSGGGGVPTTGDPSPVTETAGTGAAGGTDGTGTDTAAPVDVPTASPALLTALADLDLALDGRRFAYMNVGSEVIVVNVVRGVDEAGATALVRSCTPPGVDVRTQLVDRSQTELEALEADVAARVTQRFPDLTGGWIDTDTNRVLIGTMTPPTRAQLLWVQQQWGSAVAVADLTTRRVVLP